MVFEPVLHMLAQQATLLGNVWPLADVVPEGLAARQQVGPLGEVEGLLRIHGTELRVRTRLQAGLDGVGHHQISFAVDDLLEDHHVVRMHQDSSLLQVRPDELLVSAAGVDDGRHAQLVDLF